MTRVGSQHHKKKITRIIIVRVTCLRTSLPVMSTSDNIWRRVLMKVLFMKVSFGSRYFCLSTFCVHG